MDIQGVSAAATIAIVCAIVFLLAARSWQILTRLLSGHPSFADSIMCEAAQRFRDELQQLSRDQSTYLGAGLVFIVIYVAASLFDAPKLFLGYPDWQLYVLLAALVCAAIFALYRLIRTVIAWRQVSFLRDANVAIGHQLQRLTNGQGRAYHDVPTSNGIVDHVMIGQNGIYAVNVIARRHLKNGTVHIADNAAVFSTVKKPLPIVNIMAATKQLGKEFSKLAGRHVRIRSVIAVPGWDIQEQIGEEHLLVNERTLPMLSGWKDQRDYLMNDDVDALQKYLTARCTRATA